MLLASSAVGSAPLAGLQIKPTLLSAAQVNLEITTAAAIANVSATTGLSVYRQATTTKASSPVEVVVAGTVGQIRASTNQSGD